MACEFKQDSEFRKLSKQVGSEELASYTYYAYGKAYPDMKTTTQIKREMGISSNVAYDDGVISNAIKVRKYNAKNGTSHFFTKERIGQSLQYRLEFHINYLPVNLERQRQRDAARSERDKSWYDFQQRDFNTLTQEQIKEYNRIKNLVENDEVEEVKEERYGVTESLPELKVHILGNNQYEVGGEIYATYEEALNAANPDPFELMDEFNVVSLPKIDVELQYDIDNMIPSDRLLDYLYKNGTQRLGKEKFEQEASNLMVMLHSRGYDKTSIMDAIKCL